MLKRLLTRLRRDRRGASATEYGLICAMIVIAMVAALKNVAYQTSTMWNNVSTTAGNAMGGG